MKFYKSNFLFLIIALFILSLPLLACSGSIEEKTNDELNMNNEIELIVDGMSFSGTLYDNATTKSFRALLPLSVEMKDYSDNEKYYNLSEDLPTHSINLKTVSSGDLMLFGSSTLVLFYEEFNTSYSYSKIAKVEDAERLSVLLRGKKSVNITFQLKNKIQKTNNMKQTEIFPKGLKAEANFVGTAWVEMLVTDSNKTFDTQVYNVTFEPGCRNSWHAHPGGQLLLVTSGTGYYQEKGKPIQLLKVGDVVEINPNVVHWHGATPNDTFVHIGITTQVENGDAIWYDPVTDEEYNSYQE